MQKRRDEKFSALPPLPAAGRRSAVGSWYGDGQTTLSQKPLLLNRLDSRRDQEVTPYRGQLRLPPPLPLP
jgi:hypothetical protein